MIINPTVSSLVNIKTNRYATITWTYNLYAPGSYIISCKLYRFVGALGTYYDKNNIPWNQASTIILSNDDGDRTYNDTNIPNLTDVINGRRVLYYKIELDVHGTNQDKLPWVVLPLNVTVKVDPTDPDNDYYRGNGYIIAYSTKTQVINNILYLEGDVCWGWGSNSEWSNFSRTAIDARGYAANPPVVWATSRNPGKVIKFNLYTGQQLLNFYPFQGNHEALRGITIDPGDGAAIIGKKTGNTGGACLADSNSVTQQTWNSGAGYGMTIVSPGEYAATGHDTFTRYSRVGGRISTNFNIRNINDSNKQMYVYGICTAPDGSVWCSPVISAAHLTKSIWCEDRNYFIPFPTEITWNVWKGTTTRGIAAVNRKYNSNNKLISYEIWIACSSANPGIVLCVRIENGGNEITRTGSITYTYLGTLGVGVNSDARAVGEDSNGNVWIGTKDGILRKYYIGCDDGYEFPTGGYCRYPTTNYEGFQHNTSAQNTKFIEYIATRDPSADPQFNNNQDLISMYNAIFSNTNSNLNKIAHITWDTNRYDVNQPIDSAKRAGIYTIELNATIWYYNYCIPRGITSIVGKRLYPRYGGAINIGYDNRNLYYFGVACPYKAVNNSYTTDIYESYVYSDFTGGVGSLLGSSYTENIIVNPATVLSNVESFMLTGVNTTNPLDNIDGNVWNIDHPKNTISGTTIYKYTTGYDDLKVLFNVKYNENGTAAQKIEIKYTDTGSWYQFTPNVLKTISTNKTYNDPTQYGLPGSLIPIGSGSIRSDARVTFYPDLYTNGNYRTVSLSPLYTTILERWPSACFGINIYDREDYRGSNWGAWDTDYDYSWNKYPLSRSITLSGGRFNNGTIYEGIDPLSASITDFSISRSWPITGWHFNISKTDSYSPGSYIADISSTTYTTKDSRVQIENIVNNVIPLNGLRYGTYTVSLTTYSQMHTKSPNTFTQYIRVNELEPYANFWPISAKSVPNTYSDDTIGIAASSVISSLYAKIDCDNNGTPFVSGWAPNTTVWFVDSSEAHTFPISSYYWDFGDMYDMDTNNELVTATSITNGTFLQPNWKTDQTNHIISHTYVMPGVYDVTLMVRASTTETSDLCSNYVDLDKFQVFVDEIPPQCGVRHSLDKINWTTSDLITGLQSPQTIYYNASTVIAGSFPIHKLEFNFGDGSDIVTIMRSPSSSTYLDGVSTINIIDIDPLPFSEDTVDPRNKIIQHTFNTYYVASSFVVTMSAYACNTNTMNNTNCSLSVINIEPLPLPITPIEKRHLIKSRFIKDDNLLLVFEGETPSMKSIYNVVIGENNAN